MRRWLLALTLAGAVVAPGAAAPETTTISGTVYLPSGGAAAGGNISCELSTSGTADDGGTQVTVAGRTRTTIASDGTVSFTLVPNDAITPAGTYYTCRHVTTGPTRASWTEVWQVDTTPDPVDIGSVTRLSVAPGITVGDYLEYLDTEPSGSCTANESPKWALDTHRECQCSSGTWSCTTPAASDISCTDCVPLSTETSGNYAASTSEGGPATSLGDSDDVVSLTGTIQAADVDGDGSGLKTTRIIEAWAHASKWGDPNYYLAPAVFDQWVTTFGSWGHHLETYATQSESTDATLEQCYAANCANYTQYLCVTDPDGATATYTATDPDSDSTDEFVVGDVVTIGSASSYAVTKSKDRGHVITAIATDNVNCGAAGTNNKWTVSPGLYQPDINFAPGTDTALTGSETVYNLWMNSAHPPNGGRYLIGWQLGYASRSIHGSHGPNLLANGAWETHGTASASTTVNMRGWTTDDGQTSNRLTSQLWKSVQNESSFQCSEGDAAASGGTADCAYYSAGNAGWIQNTRRLSLAPGERYVVDGLWMPDASGGDYWVIVSDTDGDGLLEEAAIRRRTCLTTGARS